ncbi:PDZ domain-containing protein [Sphingomonas colocasiae]|nr:PDZ domain-containing protein [Sphingomonas colocasiae]
MLIAALCGLVSTPALADEYYAVTPSGATEMHFAEPPSAVVGQLASKCIDARWTVISSTTSEVVCESPMSMGESILGQVLMGNSYSTPPRRFFRFNVADLRGISRVQASGWIELQMAFGQMKRTDFSGPEFHNNILNFLGAAGGKLPVGTRFPNHATIGVTFDTTTVGKFMALRVTKIEPGSPAERAGIQIGDLITQVAKKRFKDPNSFLDATAKAATLPTYEVGIERSGKMLSIPVERAFRADIAEAVQPIVVASAAPPPPPAAPISVADELQKLAKLKETGVLTEAEFEAEKRRLLSR